MSDHLWNVETPRGVPSRMSPWRATAVFGALGIVWAAQLASVLRAGCYAHDDALVWVVLPVIVPAAMCVLGCVLGVHAQRAQSRPKAERLGAAALLVPTAGVLTGLVSALVWWPEPAAIVSGMGHGLVFGAVALVLLSPIIVAMQRVSPARSLMDVANRYSIWSYAACAACVSSLLAAVPWKDYPRCSDEPWEAMARRSSARSRASSSRSCLPCTRDAHGAFFSLGTQSTLGFTTLRSRQPSQRPMRTDTPASRRRSSTRRDGRRPWGAA